MRFTIEVTCKHCGRKFLENIKIYHRTYILNGGTIDTDCPYDECSKVADGSEFKVVGIPNEKTHETEFKCEKDLLEIFDKE